MVLSSLSQLTIEKLSSLGVKKYVVCAGSRNAELIHALTESSSELFRHFEERSAAFFALGKAKQCLEPVAVITTSGTAAAELLPACIEAHYSGVPLVLITADRPSSFRGTGAPQAIEQVSLFGPYAECFDVSSVEQLPKGKKLRIVVLNNSGGQIFSMLPYFKEKFSGKAEAQLLRSHSRDFEFFAKAWGFQYLLGADWETLPKSCLIELRPDNEESRAFAERLRQQKDERKTRA